MIPCTTFAGDRVLGGSRLHAILVLLGETAMVMIWIAFDTSGVQYIAEEM